MIFLQVEVSYTQPYSQLACAKLAICRKKTFLGESKFRGCLKITSNASILPDLVSCIDSFIPITANELCQFHLSKYHGFFI